MKTLIFAAVLLLVPAVARAQVEESFAGEPSPASYCAVDANRLATGAASSAANRFAKVVCLQIQGTLLPSGAPPAGAVGASASWQATIVTGLGDVLASRARTEVEAWFEDLVRDRLCKLTSKAPAEEGESAEANRPSGKETLWFPATCKLARDRKGAGQQLASSLVGEAIRSDLQRLIENVAYHLGAKLAKVPAAKAMLATAPIIAATAYQLTSRKSPLFLLRGLSSNVEVREQCAERKVRAELTPACMIVFAGIAVHYYGFVIETPRTNGNLDLKKLRESAIGVFAAGELQAEVVEAMKCANCQDAVTVPTPITAFFDVANGTKEETIEKLLEVFQDLVDINDLVREVAEQPDRPRTKELLAELDQLLAHLELLLWDKPPHQVQALRRFVQGAIAFANRDYSAGVLALVDAVQLLDSSLPEWAGRFLPLVVDLAEAKTSGDVSAALERAIAPVGAWRLKRQKALWSITGLVGGAAGYEHPLDASAMGGASIEGGLAAGLMAPVGLQLSTPLGESSSLGLLVSLLDVGQVTWTRVTKQEQSDDEAGTAQVPDGELSKVFSPGAYLTIGLGDSPLTIGIGASYAPALRSYTYQLDEAERTQDVSVLRFGIFAAVDVTLLPL